MTKIKDEIDIIWNSCWELMNKTYYYLRPKNRKRLQSFKNKHQGKRCFIIGNGPSLNYTDLEHLKDDVVMVSNSFIKVLDKLSYTPTYYFAQDASVVKDNIQYIRETNNITRFIYSYYNKRYHAKGTINYTTKKQMVGFSDDIVKGVYGGWTVTYSMIQFAVYMGFSEIYLLGVDFNYAKDNTEINSDCYFDNKLYNPNRHYALPKTDISFAAFAKSREYCEKHGISIFNATRGGKLEIFERIDFDKLFHS
ncbi:MAG: 6-hydroxymethylpterin diphosphokinase MptE-like protein [Dysgonomonas sp.]|nr:6-hydroxymethylpterin diphosphokinase MptE-like protein [Dysgonomonas sp.]